ncbi:uncharacterized protein LOC123554713 [Mercenaria mercenaria]|uniref:uncharacterized protein LOC123554713 n=1 Tax=Mercenaria mercenaria TaxID=6596 RepID=UPI001E1D5271|nr:uncharacterized protein LOC123554713 [Mercenaria mercenaria]
MFGRKKKTYLMGLTGDVSKKDREKYTVKRCFLFTLIMTTICEMVILLALVGHCRLLRQDITSPRKQQMCLDLQRFYLAGGDEANEQCPDTLKKTFDKKKNSDFCCRALIDAMDKFSTKVVAEKYNSDAYPEMSSMDLKNCKCKATNHKQPNATLVDLSHYKKPVQARVSSNFVWNTDPPSYASSRLRHLKDYGTQYVERPGYYYISAQLKTRIAKMNDKDETPDSTFRHYVNKGTGVVVILECTQSQCEMASDVSESTSVLGAVFNLEVGATSQPQNIVF